MVGGVDGTDAAGTKHFKTAERGRLLRHFIDQLASITTRISVEDLMNPENEDRSSEEVIDRTLVPQVLVNANDQDESESAVHNTEDAYSLPSFQMYIVCFFGDMQRNS